MKHSDLFEMVSLERALDKASRVWTRKRHGIVFGCVVIYKYRSQYMDNPLKRDKETRRP